MLQNMWELEDNIFIVILNRISLFFQQSVVEHYETNNRKNKLDSIDMKIFSA